MKQHGSRPSLIWVEGINFELTYGCNLSCAHCLQADLRARGLTGWAAPGPIRQAILDAHALGWVGLGINFSGGEILRAGSPLPRLLETTANLGIPVRVNTNGWWGRARHLSIGDRLFADADAVIAWLQDAGVAMLALSYDRRVAQYPGLWRSVVAVIDHCERRALPTELILTGVSDSEAGSLRAWLQARNGRPCDRLTVGVADLVDLGGAARPDAMVTPQAAAGRLRQTGCRLRGFYRPRYLHVAPDGGVRSCMMAAGAGWLGNIHHERLPSLARGFNDNPVVRWFAANAERPRVPAHGLPGRHPCAVAVALVRVLEGKDAAGNLPKGQGDHKSRSDAPLHLIQFLPVSSECHYPEVTG